MPDGLSYKIRVWDLPTRLFHWSLAITAIGLVVTGKMGGDAVVWHARLGYAAGTLLLFRLCWGWLGGHWSRFNSFPPSPRAAWAYLRDKGPAAPIAGHNPLGSLSVYAMVVFLLAQVASGLFSANKDDFAGPLSIHVSNATVYWLTWYHRNIGQRVLIGLFALHVIAIGYYLVRGNNLVGAMVHGDKTAAEPHPSSRDDAGSRLRAAALLALCAFAIWGLVQLGG